MDKVHLVDNFTNYFSLKYYQLPEKVTLKKACTDIVIESYNFSCIQLVYGSAGKYTTSNIASL